MHGGVHISAVVHIHRLAAATLLHHAPERLLDVGDGGRRRRVFAVEEVDVEVMAALLEVVQSEGTAAVEAQVLGIVGGGNTVGAEPVASRKRLQRRRQAVHVIPAMGEGDGGLRRERQGRGGRGPKHLHFLEFARKKS
jgi:hypothetical protein